MTGRQGVQVDVVVREGVSRRESLGTYRSLGFLCEASPLAICSLSSMILRVYSDLQAPSNKTLEPTTAAKPALAAQCHSRWDLAWRSLFASPSRSRITPEPAPPTCRRTSYVTIFLRCRSELSGFPCLGRIARLRYKSPTSLVGPEDLPGLIDELRRLGNQGSDAHDLMNAAREAMVRRCSLTISGDMCPELGA